MSDCSSVIVIHHFINFDFGEFELERVDADRCCIVLRLRMMAGFDGNSHWVFERFGHTRVCAKSNEGFCVLAAVLYKKN